MMIKADTIAKIIVKVVDETQPQKEVKKLFASNRNVILNEINEVSPPFIYNGQTCIEVRCLLTIYLNHHYECHHINDYTGKVFPALKSYSPHIARVISTQVLGLAEVSSRRARY
ncbi:hypothetical protein [Desertibacillus haloalkaliphilus]|uniref:hypothetical protein n=1 Tax=Desertibacillus haloalkaliphilus TaxID=1328930 RepID=UPI001C268EAE|nr:hypothetical protein [Desertibacillus haloalkaliphilus]MBU8907915.1 hypothetical protein [Desertibacillus haloalkaliphilus]